MVNEPTSPQPIIPPRPGRDSHTAGSQPVGSQPAGSQPAGTQQSGAQQSGAQEFGAQEFGGHSGAQEFGGHSGAQEFGGQEFGPQHHGANHPGAQEFGAGHSGPQNRGGAYQGGQQPGTQHPGPHHLGAGLPGNRHPGAEHPGPQLPGTQHPGTQHPGPPPTSGAAPDDADQPLVQAPVPAPAAELDLPLSRKLVGWLQMALGVPAIVLGGLWTLQGLGVISGDAMSGVTLWAIIGPIVAVVGLVLIVLGVKRRARFKATGH